MDSHKVETTESVGINPSLQYRRTIHVFWATEIALIFAILHMVYITESSKAYPLIFVMLFLTPVYFLAKKGKEGVASSILLMALTLMSLFYMWDSEGFRDEILFAFPAIICFSALTLNNRLIWALFILMFVNILAIGLLNELGIIIHPNTGSSINSAIILLIILTVTTYAIRLVSSDLSEANKHLLQYKVELEEMVRIRTAELEKSLLQLTETRDQLVESEKMASLGSMVAGIAHEINTPIGIGVTASSHLAEQTKTFKLAFENNELTKSGVARYVENVDKSADLIFKNLDRAAELVRNFKEAAVEQTHAELSEFDMGAQIDEIIHTLLPKIIDTNIKVKVDYAQPFIVYSSSGALAQVISNLFINSIIHGFEGLNDGNIKISIRQKENHIIINYVDDGLGMAPDVQQHIFEPFFTTKRGKGGSGLGMHIVYNLVTQSLGGAIKCIDSANNKNDNIDNKDNENTDICVDENTKTNTNTNRKGVNFELLLPVRLTT